MQNKNIMKNKIICTIKRLSFQQKLVKYARITVIFLLLVLVTVLLNSISFEKLSLKITNYSYYSTLSILLLRFTSAVIPILPGSAYALLAGSLLGFKKGLFVIYLADIASCVVCFGIARQFGYRVVKKLIGNQLLTTLEAASNSYISNKPYLIVLCLMTGFHDFFSYAIGLTNLKFSRYFVALLLSSCITVPLMVGIGSGIGYGGILNILLMMLLIVVLLSIRKKLKAFLNI